MNALVKLIGSLVEPFGKLVEWLVNSRKRKGNAIAELQSTIDILITENTRLHQLLADLSSKQAEILTTVVALRKENSELKIQLSQMQADIESYKTILNK